MHALHPSFFRHTGMTRVSIITESPILSFTCEEKNAEGCWDKTIYLEISIFTLTCNIQYYSTLSVNIVF